MELNSKRIATQTTMLLSEAHEPRTLLEYAAISPQVPSGNEDDNENHTSEDPVENFQPLVQSAAESVTAAVSTIFSSAQFSDMSVFLGDTGVALSVHRVIVGLRSPLLYNHLVRTVKDGIMKLTWQRSTVHTAWRVFHYIYRGDYPESTSAELEIYDEEPPLLRHPRVFLIACQLEMNGLKKLTLEKFTQQLEKHCSIEDMAKCALEIYGQHPSESAALRDAIVAGVKSRLDPTSFDGPLRTACQTCGAFAADVISAMITA